MTTDTADVIEAKRGLRGTMRAMRRGPPHRDVLSGRLWCHVRALPEGDRLGQGGGWYDRFLCDVREHCVTIGVGFEPQLIDDLPVEPHDVQLDLVITDTGVEAGETELHES